MPRLFIILIGLSFFLPTLHAQEGTMSESERQELLAKSDSLFAAGVDLYNNGKFEEAISLFSQSDQIDKAVLDSISNRRDYSSWWLASCYYQLGDNVRASETHEYYNYAPVDRRLTVKSDSLSAAGLIAYNNGDIENALTYFEQCAEIGKAIVGEKHVWYLNTLSVIAFSYLKLAVYNSSLSIYSEAIRLGTEALNIFEKVCGKEHPVYATSLGNLANYNYHLGNYQEAIRLGTEAMNIRGKVYGTEHHIYATSLNNLAEYNSSLGNYTEAIRLCAEALNIREKVLGKEHSDYATSLNNLAQYKSNLGNYMEAVRLGTEALNIREKLFGKEHPDYAASLNNLAQYNSYLGNYAEAIRLCTEALNTYEKALGKEHPDYATSLNNLAEYKSNLGNYMEAVRLGTEALNIREKLLGKEHSDYAASLNNLAQYNSYLGNYAEAISLETDALNIFEKIYGKEHLYYATTLNNLALNNAHLGNYTEAIRLGTEVLNITEKLYGKEYPYYATSLNNLASYNSSLGNYSEAIRLDTDALNIFEKIYGKEHLYYATTLSNLATNNAHLGNYTEAIRFGTEVLNIIEKLYSKEYPFYATSLNNLASYNASLGFYLEAISLGIDALNIDEKVYGTEHPDYATSLGNLASYYFYSGDIEPTNHYSLQYSELATSLVKKTFAGLTSSQRQQFWQKYKAWYEKYAHRFSYILPSDTLTMNGYNGVLLSKGLLLNSEIEFSKLIQESGDNEALVMYEDLKGLRLQINKLREKPKAERYANVDSLERIAQAKESALIERSKVYGDYTKNLVITWDQVQEKLGAKDLAVEFVSFPLNADSTMYIAYALKKDWKCPRMIPLFEEKQLLGVQKGDRYTTDSISRLVWKPLDDVMRGVERVYFAPSGELYNIAIESIPSHEDGGETLVGEHRDFYRLSSTRELALIKDESRWDEAAVYGGLQYGMSVEGMIEEDGKYEKAAGQKRGDSTPSYYVVREDSIGRGDRDLAQGLAYLEGTKKEAEAITHDLEQKAVDARLFTDSIGTETSFKALGGKKTSIIHIGTHGFFNDKKKENKDDRLQLLGMDYQPRVIEDDALTRSGLYFAGADNVRLNGPSAVPDSIDDGRLTAAEITQLDLRGLDMVVLSACQTGLGEITGDGVFGLQRGFKKAGAQTIVMSLWKVDDDATTEFMTTFFDNMKIDRDGHPLNKHEAFKEAQNKLKQDKDKYSDPYCWAAFVMLDGIR